LIVTDIHAHILPGVDDGPSSLDDSLRLAEAYLKAGTGRVVATPHVNHRWGVRPGPVRESYELLVEAMRAASIDLILELGGEVELTTAIELDDEQLDAFRMAGGEWLLIEPPTSGPSAGVHSMIYEIEARGYRVIIAHPERCQTFQGDIGLLQSLVAGGALTQVTAASLAGGFGRTAQKTAKQLFELEIVHTVAADAHDAELRGPEILSHLRQSRYEGMYEWFCQQMPEMIISGGPVPKRPPAPAARSGWRGLFGRPGLVD
jgi:protein-tyrosine phosphatase